MITVIARNGGHQQSHAAALVEGLTSLGLACQRSMYTSARTKFETVACWGWRVGLRFREEGSRVLVMERGYLGDRFAWTSLGWNGLNGLATFPEPPDDGGERFARHHGHLMQPWRDGGRYALLIGQVPGDAALGGKNLQPWYIEQAALAAERFKLPVMFRPHPLAGQRSPIAHVPGTQRLDGLLSQALQDAAVVITYNSNTAVESVLAGRPTIAMSKGSMAWEVTSHAISEPLAMPDRMSWAHRLAWKQWRLDEIRNGSALERLFANDLQRSAA